MQIEIRRMHLQDVPQVAELEQIIFTVPWSLQGFYDTLNMNNTIFLAAVEETTICGYCGMYTAADEGEITNVAVSPSYRRYGIGEALVSSLLEEGNAHGIQNYLLEVRVSNEGAIRLYQKLGFLPEGIRKGFYEKPREDALVMIRKSV